MDSLKGSAKIERLEHLDEQDLEDLCEATDEAIIDGNGFGWLTPPPRRKLESYWRGVLLVPDREVYAARLEGRIVGSAQLIGPPSNNEAGAHIVQLTTFFIAPWARGHGLARGMLRELEASARRRGFKQIDLDVRASQVAAITLYESLGFERWAVKEHYALVKGEYVAGYFYSKDLEVTRRRRQINSKKTQKKSALT